jgi:hypothetical protein
VDATIRYVIAGEKAVFYPTDRERSYWPAEEHRAPKSGACTTPKSRRSPAAPPRESIEIRTISFI